MSQIIIIISLKNQRQRKALLIPFKQNHDKEAIMNGLHNTTVNYCASQCYCTVLLFVTLQLNINTLVYSNLLGGVIQNILQSKCH